MNKLIADEAACTHGDGSGEMRDETNVWLFLPCKKSSGIRLCGLGLLAVLLILLAACRTADPEELQSVSLIVTNGDGTGAEPIIDGLAAIQGNRIVAVGQAADFKIPAEAVVIDARGGTILPGIFNAHMHNGYAVGTRRVLFLLDGVTSVCDLGVPLFMMKGFEEEGFKAGPAARGFKAGPIITAPSGFAEYLEPAKYEIQGEEEAETAVRDLHARGVDYIKVVLEPGYDGENFPVLNVQELRSIVSTAHANDLLVRAHVTKSDMLDRPGSRR